MIYSPVLAVYFSSKLHMQGEVSRVSPASVRLHPCAQVCTGAQGPGWRASRPVSPGPVLRPLIPQGSLGTWCLPRLEGEPACLPSARAQAADALGLPEDAVSAEAGGWAWGLRAGGLHAVHRGPFDILVRERERDLEHPGPRLLLPTSGVSSLRSVSSGLSLVTMQLVVRRPLFSSSRS